MLEADLRVSERDWEGEEVMDYMTKDWDSFVLALVRNSSIYQRSTISVLLEVANPVGVRAKSEDLFHFGVVL